jgi:hypothetical protein
MIDYDSIETYSVLTISRIASKESVDYLVISFLKVFLIDIYFVRACYSY